MTQGGNLTRRWIVASCVIAAIAAVAVAVGARSRPTNDYLQPIDGPGAFAEFTRDYEKAWRAKLVVAPGDVATFVAQPSFEPEAAALISTVAGKEREYVLTCAFANQQIWHELNDPAGSSADRPPLTIRRVDIPLPGHTAEPVGEAWLALLRLPRKATECCTLDGEPTIYSAFDKDSDSESIGRAHNPGGGRSAELERIGKLLLQYCQATPDQRDHLDAELQARSRSLSRDTWLEHLTRRWSGP